MPPHDESANMAQGLRVHRTRRHGIHARVLLDRDRDRRYRRSATRDRSFRRRAHAWDRIRARRHRDGGGIRVPRAHAGPRAYPQAVAYRADAFVSPLPSGAMTLTVRYLAFVVPTVCSPVTLDYPAPPI